MTTKKENKKLNDLKLLTSIVCNKLQIDPHLVMETEKREYIFAKMVIAYLAEIDTLNIATWSEIAKYLGYKNHGSIGNCKTTIKNLIDVYKDKREIIEYLKERCKDLNMYKSKHFVTSSYFLIPGI